MQKDCRDVLAPGFPTQSYCNISILNKNSCDANMTDTNINNETIVDNDNNSWIMEAKAIATKIIFLTYV